MALLVRAGRLTVCAAGWEEGRLDVCAAGDERAWMFALLVGQ